MLAMMTVERQYLPAESRAGADTTRRQLPARDSEIGAALIKAPRAARAVLHTHTDADVG
ncbi:hypothetical protein PV682_34245 [Streptomyces niveiscabiei]|uniref:hypothetical protein n=1 Tax=Streptomyces niveiscabiei TaxID=164115 RepID=UPI0029B2FC51|nr:hypothetical protein [Streptomyces niveiscabiei]MDX3386474.1 hypothetical protein [Streptomyces niveiscabiei]